MNEFESSIALKSKMNENGLSSFLNPLSLNEMKSITEKEVNISLNDRIKEFKEIDQKDFEFIGKFLALYPGNPILKLQLDQSNRKHSQV